MTSTGHGSSKVASEEFEIWEMWGLRRFKNMIGGFICKVERRISELTFKGIRCVNCEACKVETRKTIFENDEEILQCTRFNKRARSWQYCYYFRKAKKEDKQNIKVKNKVRLDKKINEKVKISIKKDELCNNIKLLKDKESELEEEINYLQKDKE